MKKILVFVLVLLFMNGVSAASFSVNPVFIKMVGQQGAELEQQITVISNSDNQEFLLETGSSFFTLSEGFFTLDKGQDKSVRLVFNKLDRGLYYGKIKITADDEVEVPVVVGIESTNPEFGVSTQQFASDLAPGQNIKIETDFVRLRGQGSGAIANYSLQDVNGKILYSETEVLKIDAIGQHIKTTKSLVVPEVEGQYILSVVVSDLGSRTVSISPSIFSVAEQKSGSKYALILAIVVLLMTIVFVIFNYAWVRTLNQSTDYWKNEINSLKNEKFSDSARQLRKIEYKLYVLEQAYERGYIKKKSYLEARRALNSLASKLKKRL